MTIKLTYFNIQGVAEKIRLAFTLNGVEFEDHRVNHEEWTAIKPQSKFGQLPLMQIDDGPVLAQSDALLRLAGTMGAGKLVPSDPMEQFKVNEAINLIDDLARSWVPAHSLGMAPEKFGYTKEFIQSEEGKAKIKELREKWFETELPKYAKLIEDLIKANGGVFLASTEGPTIADCYAVPYLNQFQRGFIDHIPATSLDQFSELTAYIKRFYEIPEVAKYYSK
mmetsp:Transcript_21618/g.42464  ORF Transcript_21618/g.42464 Transcript_21618/m.42464 type:complete len:223 (+) Transcript_21618:79-747(+)|eukprot:CAMPEP_0171520812 /NCGR_PEP_ID=MMETSP0959-20130129/6761_1 /TAXON_ID=87120 /ORGANISM="Aurantiochytrium limacinum, Strain ATCCMYA-1381" /LENGTH=222 /DNA_ID=CAMNT_0012060597 /DNA_START=66 /DNA_END=734 /DNA_ORIENTATION=-